MDKFKIEDGSFTVGINVKLTKRDKNTGRIIETREGHNQCLRTQLMGIAKFLNGDFNPTAPHLQYYDWIPRYLALGTNIGSSTSGSGITSNVNINDTRLLNEISPRMKLNDRQTIVNHSSQRYVQVVISTYLPENYYNGYDIAEAGLFSKESGSNGLFRITFDPIHKEKDSVVEVSWTISIISVESENQPYVELNKDDLKIAIDATLDRFVELYAPFNPICTELKKAVEEYGRSNSTQTTVDNETAAVGTQLSKMRDWTPLHS